MLNDPYKRLLKKGFSKQQIHAAMHTYMLLQIQKNKTAGKSNSYLHTKHSARKFLIIKLTNYQIAKLFSYATAAQHKIAHEKPPYTFDKRFAFRFKLFAFFKESHFLKSFISKMVSFIKTQFAKKPKNPV